MGAGKPLAILAYLALSPDGRVGRDHLAELFWPGAPLSDARHDFRQILYRLRQLADGREVVRAAGSELRLAPHVRFDFMEGEAALAAGDLARACQLLRGNFFNGFAIGESLEFERWAEAQRSRFRDGWGRAAQSLVEQWLGSGEAERALALAEELHALRPFSDHAARLVMTALAHLGRHATALARYQAYRELLMSELEEQPGEELEAYAGELERYLGSRPSPSESLLPFVGRAAPWAALEETWRAVEKSSGAAVLIEGAAGLGKTRLLAELGRWVTAAGGVALSAKCYEIEQAVPYGAVADALGAVARRTEPAGLDGAWLAEAARILPELRERFPGLPAVDRGEGSPASKRRLHQALARCLEAIAEEQPLLVVVDDVQWADVPSLEVLHFFAHRLRAARVLLLISYRPAELSPEARRFARSLVADRLAWLVVLEPLTAADVGQLLRGLAAFDDPEVELAVTEHLHRASAGNPLFLSELLQALSRGATLRVRDGRWDLASGVRSEDLPKTLGKLMGDRVDRLAPWMRACVETLAVIAGEATVELLAQTLQVSEPRAELALGVLEEERLVRRAGGGAWELVHDELRRLVYQGIVDERRRLLHSAVGTALEARGEATRTGGAARLAHHFDQAGDLERAHRYALLAAQEANALAAAEVAQAHLDLAAAHAPKALPPAGSSPAIGWRWLVGRREARVAGAAVALALVGGLLVGGLYVSSTARAAGGGADFRQGTLFLRHQDVLSGATHRLRWPAGSDTLGAIEALGGAPPGFPPALVRRAVTESNEMHEKVFVARGTDTVQLTFGLSDDMRAEWAPDGGHFLLVRGWRASATRYQQNVFLVDSVGRLARALTETRYQDTWAAWSPTGTRFAFNRDSAGLSAVRIADADGENAWNVTERFGLPRTAGRASLAPREDRLVVVHPDTGSGFGVVYVLDLVDTVARPLVAPTRGLVDAGALWSPDGQWLAYLTRRGEQHAVWQVRADGTAGPVLAAVLPSTLWLSAWHAGRPKYASSVVIEPGTVSLRWGFGRRVEARVSAPNGAPLSTVLRWSVADTSVAAVDEVGFVRGRAPGTTVLIASAGGFRADTATVNVSFAPVDTLLLEDWSGGLDTTRWIPFGYPRPLVIPRALPDGRAAFFNNGDYNHGSGAVSAEVFDVGEDGLVVEVEAGIRFTGMHWQHWGIYLHPDPFGGGRLEVAGGPVGFGSSGHSPTIALPLRGCGGPSVPDRGLLRAGWRRVVLVVRPDGLLECWADGRLLGKGEVPTEARGVPLHLVLRGHSVGTRLYHGRVVVRRGVRY